MTGAAPEVGPATKTAAHLLEQADSCRPDASPAHTPNPDEGTGATQMLSQAEPATPLDALVVYVASALPDERHDRLTFAASEAARIVALHGTTRTTALVRLVLAAELAGIGRRDAETILRDALTGAVR